MKNRNGERTSWWGHWGQEEVVGALACRGWGEEPGRPPRAVCCPDCWPSPGPSDRPSFHIPGSSLPLGTGTSWLTQQQHSPAPVSPKLLFLSLAPCLTSVERQSSDSLDLGSSGELLSCHRSFILSLAVARSWMLVRVAGSVFCFATYLPAM